MQSRSFFCMFTEISVLFGHCHLFLVDYGVLGGFGRLTARVLLLEGHLVLVAGTWSCQVPGIQCPGARDLVLGAHTFLSKLSLRRRPKAPTTTERLGRHLGPGVQGEVRRWFWRSQITSMARRKPIRSPQLNLGNCQRTPCGPERNEIRTKC